jgi:hypothetical protein
MSHASPIQAETKAPTQLYSRSAGATESRSAPGFSGFGVYLGDLLVCTLREHDKSPQDNGLWLVLSEATDPADPELRREFPSIRSIELLNKKITHWLLIPSDSPHFETDALHARDLLLRHDSRLGRIPASRR